MKIEFRRFRPDDVAAIERLNERFATAELPHRVGREEAGAGDVRIAERPIVERLFVAADESEIRGAVWLKEQRFWSRGEAIDAGWAIFPVSESLIDARFSGIPAGMIHGLLRLQPRLMALGMGGHGGPFARLLAAARFAQSIVPLQFRIVRPARALQELTVARSTGARRVLADALGYSGLASLGNAVFTAARSASARRASRDVEFEEVASFAPWADAIWLRARDAYAFAAVRDATSLAAVFPAGFEPVRRLRVRRAGEDIGWACVQTHEAAGGFLAQQFGNLRVGILTDAFGLPQDADAIVYAAVEQLLAEQVDLVITNQLHPAWQRAAERLAFLTGPSNLAFYRSPAAEKRIAPESGSDLLPHVTRSDGDGPERR